MKIIKLTIECAPEDILRIEPMGSGAILYYQNGEEEVVLESPQEIHEKIKEAENA